MSSEVGLRDEEDAKNGSIHEREELWDTVCGEIVDAPLPLVVEGTKDIALLHSYICFSPRVFYREALEWRCKHEFQN